MFAEPPDIPEAMLITLKDDKCASPYIPYKSLTPAVVSRTVYTQFELNVS